MTDKEIPKAYEPKGVEDSIYKAWEESGFFNPDNLPGKRKESFTISMPPPNVTGILHLGHALENSLMDIQIRYQRMRGKKALLLPGTDHAAIATQARVEDNLKKEGMKNPRQELGREKLLEKIREYSEESKSTILNQIRRMGTSCDWSRLAYTFDENRSKAVYTLFKKMYDDGLVYRGYRVVNWSVKGQSTCSEDELIYVDKETNLYTFKYSKDFPIPIATTRPETKLGDTAVAVNPSDDRYKEYIGQEFTVDVGAQAPLKIKVIADKNVDPKYGTGALGVTPAHSAVDFEMYQANKEIGLIQVIGVDGKMTKEAGKNYEGLGVLQARDKFVEWLTKSKLIISEEKISHSAGTSDRFGDVVEAIPMDQWFVDVNKEIKGRKKSLKQLMQDAVTVGHNGDKKKKVNITPEGFNKMYLDRVENLYDWNISRQIWWGHRIPVWYKGEEVAVSDTKPKGDGWEQDPDTLDTWFSSGAWTFSTLGWPEKTDDLKDFHPTSWMQMGYEIVYLWLMRMILMSTYAVDDIPFHEVYVHGMVRDKDGKKFSKSLGNGMDPIEMSDKYGTDALRLSLIKGNTPGNDSRFYDEKIEGARNFVNKLWNVSRYILMNVKEVKIIEKQPKPKTLADAWILSKLNELIASSTENLEKSNFSVVSENIYEFTWNELADWYLEVAKVEEGKDEFLLYILQSLLKLWHPFTPFVTEKIWSKMNSKEFLMIQDWPSDDGKRDKVAEDDFDMLRDIVTAIRNVRSEANISPAKKLNAIIISSKKSKLIESQMENIKRLARLDDVEVKSSGDKPAESLASIISGAEIYLPVSGMIDVGKEVKRLEQEAKRIADFVEHLGAKLKNERFLERAPKEIIDIEKEKLADHKEKLEKIEQQLKALK